MKSLTWMVLSLFIVCLVASGLLSKVYTVTKVQIEKQISENVLKQLSDVLPQAKTFETIITDSLWVGYDTNKQKAGIVFKTTPEGYAGLIPILVGYGTDSVIKKIYIASSAEGLKETPGLGQKIREDKFKNQFNNKTYSDIKLTKDGGKIQAITSATISSRAVTNGIKDGIERYKKFILLDTLDVIVCDTTLTTSTMNQFCTILPGAQKFVNIVKDTVWLGYNETNKIVGIVFKTAPEGYAGLIPILVGCNTDHMLTKIYIGSPEEGLKETPGFGLQVRNADFCNQFANKKLEDLKLTSKSGKIQAISGATISSVAVLEGIKQGIEKYKQYIQYDTLKQK